MTVIECWRGFAVQPMQLANDGTRGDKRMTRGMSVAPLPIHEQVQTVHTGGRVELHRHSLQLRIGQIQLRCQLPNIRIPPDACPQSKYSLGA